MKIAFISDLHVDSSPENLKLLDHLVERLGSLNPDTFIIAGDISASSQVFEKTFIISLTLIVKGSPEINSPKIEFIEVMKSRSFLVKQFFQNGLISVELEKVNGGQGLLKLFTV